MYKFTFGPFTVKLVERIFKLQYVCMDVILNPGLKMNLLKVTELTSSVDFEPHYYKGKVG